MNDNALSENQVRTRCPNSWLIVATAVLIGLAGEQVVLAQKSDPGKDIAKGLLRALIESQLERQGRESYGPGRPVPPVVGEIPRPVNATPEMLQIRRTLASVAQESNALATLVADEAKRNPDLRRLVPDAIAFQATAAATQKRCDRENHHVSVQLSIQAIDQAWKPLAHKLMTTRGISAPLRQSVERISQMDAQLCQILGIRDQFNSRELVRASDSLASDLRTLTDEVGYIGAGYQDRSRLSARLKRLQDQSSLFANLAASGAQYQTVVAEYQSLYQSWQAMRPEVDKFASRNVVRSVVRIQNAHQTIHQMLRLEFALDEALIQKMSEGLERELNELFQSVTLEQLMALPDSRSLPSSADAVFGTAQNLVDVVTRRESLPVIGEAWVFLDERWQLFEFYLKPIRVAEIRRRIEGITQSIDALQALLGVSVSFDRRATLQQIGTLEALADHLQGTVRRWLARPGQQNVALGEETKLLSNRCRELGQLLASNRDQANLAAKCDEIIALWQQLRPRLSECQTDELESIDQTIDSFIPALIRLRNMLED